MLMDCKISIIITAHNYGKYLPKSLESALNQNYDNFEVILVNDGSTDNTKKVIERYLHETKLKVIELDGVGLSSACNRGILESKGEYIVRLDADDWFDENLLLVESNFLDQHADIDLVFCDYYTVNPHGEIIDNIQRAKVNDEIELLDRPALAAGAMYRKTCYEKIGGYNEDIRYQEDYDFWIKFIEHFQVKNISLPLMFYRQHGHSMSRNWDTRMSARRLIKKQFVSENRNRYKDKVLAVIPARNDLIAQTKIPLLQFSDSNLLNRCIKKTINADLVDKLIVLTNDSEIRDKAYESGADYVHMTNQLSYRDSKSNSIEVILFDLLKFLYKEKKYKPEIIAVIHPNSPFLKSDHITEAIDSILLYETDSVIAVLEDLSYHWKIGKHGLESVGYTKRVVRQEKDLIYKESGGLYVLKTDQFLQTHDLLGKKIGHIELSPIDSSRIYNEFDYWISKQIEKNTN
jgi:glycosyltransferase involved in cell wall biosynthesis